ncbi:MAG: glycosyltransferase family 2 protein [Patescibacteria group bacterium]
MIPKVFVNIVAWNSMIFLPDLLKSLENQTFVDFRVLVIDNGSDDGVCKYIQEEYPGITLIRNPRNIGFAPAHNQGIRYALERWGEQTNDKFVIATNPDLILDPEFLIKIIEETKKHPGVGSFGGKLLKAYQENTQDGPMREVIKSDVIDSTGLLVRKNRTFFDRGSGEKDEGQYDDEQEVFGNSGALVMYRAKALQDVRFKDEFFDHDFFAYKEDVDLAWRLQHAGWKAMFVPSAIAHHYRSMFGKEKMNIFEKIKNRLSKSRVRSFYSTRNHWSTLMKNEMFFHGLVASPRVVVHEIARVIYVLFFETKNISAFTQALLRTPKMIKKRKEIMKSRKVPAKEIYKWFV